MTSAPHPFEDAGLGKPPFILFDYQEAEGTRCDFCGTAIKHVFTIGSSDGQRFNVGSTCVFKTNDHKLASSVRAKMDEMKSRSETERINRAEALLSRFDVLADLDKSPAPDPWRAKQGDTARTWCEWMMKNSERTGKLKVAAFLERFDLDPNE